MAERQQVFEKVKKLLAEKFSVEEEKITEETEIVADLGADSLDVTDLVMSVEDEFGVEIPDEKVEKIRTVGDAVNVIMELLGSKGE